jgi:hypothetical protein
MLNNMLSALDDATKERLESLLEQIGGGLAPFDPYLHWSLSRREKFLSKHQVVVLAELMAGLSIVEADGVLYLARQFMNTNGWFWSCVPLENAQADDRMLQTMMDGAA